MPDYKSLYLNLFRTCCDAMDLLQQATLQAEELATTEDSPPLKLPPIPKEP